jgi:nucleotide-binding universal stress UspA family protein
MALKDILVFADGSLNGIARARMSGEFARAHDAHVDLCVVAEMPVRPYGEAAVVLADMLEEARQVAREDAGNAVEAMRKFLSPDRFDVRAAEAAKGEASGLAATLARAADLVIVGRPIEEDRSTLDSEILDGVLFLSGRPCLVIPRWNDARAFGKRVLIAYKAAREAARALHDALPVLRAAEKARLVVVDARSEAEGEGPLALSRLASHLARHGVALEDSRSLKGPPQEALMHELKAFEADLLVMGGYGHSRLRERVFGGVTEAMLRTCPTPMLLAH